MSIVIDNKEYKKYNISTLFTNSFNLDVNIPNFQRLINYNKVKNIIEYQLDHYKKYGFLNFVGMLHINIIKGNNKSYLIDGQHRYLALKELYIQHKIDGFIMIETIYLNHIDEMFETYKLINKNTPLPFITNKKCINNVKIITEHFMKHYPKCWTTAVRTRRPYINSNHFQEAIDFILNTVDDTNKIIYKMEELNLQLKSNYSNFINDKSITSNMIEKCNQWNFYLGLYKHISNTKYTYQWIKYITNDDFKDTKRCQTIYSKRKNIPKKVRMDCWYNHIDKNHGVVLCIICCQNEIKPSDFEAGHIISHCNGGKNCVDNLLPICSYCNKSISTENMLEYVKTYYPTNVKNFLSRKYSTNKITNTNLFSTIFKLVNVI